VLLRRFSGLRYMCFYFVLGIDNTGAYQTTQKASVLIDPIARESPKSERKADGYYRLCVRAYAGEGRE